MKEEVIGRGFEVSFKDPEHCLAKKYGKGPHLVLDVEKIPQKDGPVNYAYTQKVLLDLNQKAIEEVAGKDLMVVTPKL